MALTSHQNNPAAASSLSPAASLNITLTIISTTNQALGNGVPLRIMPLGASITYGTASSDGNGYRLPLRTRITTTAGNAVNMVGSRQSGTMRDNDVEGWPGYRIEEVHAKSVAGAGGGGGGPSDSVVGRWRPNVVLVNAGTNDATQGWNVGAAGARMEAMLRDLWRASPRAVVVLSTLLVNKGVEAERNVVAINGQFRELARRLREGEGRRVVLVDMHGGAGPARGDLADDTHPNDAGYRKMAEVWFAGLVAASEAGWLQAPEPVGGVPDDGAAFGVVMHG
ncbi:carbohydrate esterase [Chaetomidium leptoderma]|uniref:Carbohydrate esterase n=1 Tax=Chaetomidium leptoderma TaxID=669021 RepID=A0AAN6ZSC4_9PEZI|nr:carbohydrate esterase [Chaetomidium leptoderma]